MLRVRGPGFLSQLLLSVEGPSSFWPRFPQLDPGPGSVLWLDLISSPPHPAARL